MKTRNLSITAIILSLAVAFAATAAVTAPEIISQTTEAPSKKEEVFIEANQIDYDLESAIIIASGKVEVIKGEQILFADNISYDNKTNIVTAEGNVVVSSANGETFFTDKFTLSDDLKEGVINYFSAQLADGSIIAGAQATREDGNRIELKKAVYSACPIPATGSPTWQLKADEISVNEEDQRIRYYDATMEVYGVPVLYTPYFSHPTPSADRKSGFLAPSFSTDSNLGAVVQTSYYWNIAENMDLTLTPIYTSKEGLVASAEFNHLTQYGKYNFEGSYTRPDGESRGHLKGNGLFDLSTNWDFGYDVDITSDDTYLRRYNFSNDDLLTSRAYLERIEDRNYSVIQSVYFQGLLEGDDKDTTPFVPLYTKNHMEFARGIVPGFRDSNLWADFDGFAINRDLGEESRRASTSFGISVPTITSGGHNLEFAASVRADYYNIEDSTINNGKSYDETRAIPEASIAWSLPLEKNLGSGRFIIEPLVKAIISPEEDYNEGIPNEDSQDLDFSHLNLFDSNRNRGLDQVESGTRIHYGIKGGYYEDDTAITYNLGQSYRPKESSSNAGFSGLGDNFSDYVGAVGVSLSNELNLSYRFRFAQEDFRARRQEVNAEYITNDYGLSLSYIFLDFGFNGIDEKREEISGDAKIRITDEWSVLAGGRRNLAENSNVDAYGGLSYEGCCVNVNATLRREFISDRDFDAGTSFNIQIGLKNLGDL